MAEHRRSGARATLVLTPVANPAAFGLVETDETGRVLRFVEKPEPAEITTDTINAGIYVLDTSALDLIPPHEVYSIERAFFPALLRRGDLVRAHVHRRYWIDIGTPEKYQQVHRDILDGRFPVDLEGRRDRGGVVHPEASVAAGASLMAPFYVGPGCRVEAGAHLGSHACLVSGVTVAAGARVQDSVVWPGASIGEQADVEGALLGPGVRVGHDARVGRGVVLGEGAWLPPFSRCGT